MELNNQAHIPLWTSIKLSTGLSDKRTQEMINLCAKTKDSVISLREEKNTAGARPQYQESQKLAERKVKTADAQEKVRSSTEPLPPLLA